MVEAFAAWALVRILGALPLTPAGVGVVEVGLTRSARRVRRAERRGRGGNASLSRAHRSADARARAARCRHLAHAPPGRGDRVAAVIPDERGRITESRDVMSPDQGTDATPPMGHGASRDLGFCGSTGPSRRDCVRSHALCSRSSPSAEPTAPQRSWSALPRTRVGLPRRDRSCGGGRGPGSRGHVPRELGAGAGRRGRLVRRSALQRAAALKGERVASCGQFSHTPCGSARHGSGEGRRVPLCRVRREPLRRDGGSHRSTRRRRRLAAVPAAPGDPAQPGFRHLGAAPVRASGLLGGADAVVWTATFASPR